MIVYNEDTLDTASGYNKFHDAGVNVTGSPEHTDRLARGMSHSSVAPAHMQGLQFIHLTGGQSPVPGGHATYDTNKRGITGYVNEGDWANHDDNLTFNVNHEIGHHVAASTHGLTKSEGHNEAVAENFAELHSPKSSSIGDRDMHDVRSNYDAASANHGDNAWSNPDEHRRYRETRNHMVQPHEKPPEDYS